MIRGNKKYLGSDFPWNNNISWINSVLNPPVNHATISPVTPYGPGNPQPPANPVTPGLPNINAISDPPPGEQVSGDNTMLYWIAAAAIVGLYWYKKKK